MFANSFATPLFVILFWVVIFVIPIGTIRSKQIPKSELMTAIKTRLPIIISLSFFSGILNGAMSGTIGFYGGFLGAFLSWSWLLSTHFAVRYESDESQP